MTRQQLIALHRDMLQKLRELLRESVRPMPIDERAAMFGVTAQAMQMNDPELLRSMAVQLADKNPDLVLASVAFVIGESMNKDLVQVTGSNQ